MKNVYLIPTDKPSRLCIDNSCNELNYSEIEGLSSKHITNQCMYITSDEVIKEGDWVVTPNKTIMLVTTKYTTESSFMIGNSKHKGSPYYIEFCRKIILTTDQDLIKDGVQAIDYEFLDWFVKNPCERVELEKFEDGDCVIAGKEYINYSYEIIIPQEEPKQDSFTESINKSISIISLANSMFTTEPKQTLEEYEQQGMEKYAHEFKQETLEEAAENFANSKEWINGGASNWVQFSFKKGAKWQAKRMYSEEEVLKLLLDSEEYTSRFNGRTDLRSWFEQFKKK